MNSAERAKGAARQAAEGAEDAGKQAANHPAFQAMLTVGLISYGVVHLLIAFICVQIAWGIGGGGEASQSGALAELTGTAIGPILLWIIAVGFVFLGVWQLFEALWGHLDREPGRKRTVKRVGSAGKTVIYLGLAYTAATTAMGSGSSGESEETWTARLMSVTFGRILVALVGVAILALGIRLIRRGITKKFTRDLDGGVTERVLRLGQVGYVAKGIAFVIVGCLFGWAAWTYDPEKAGGLDDALRTIREAPFGAILLTLMALGLACFGVFCFTWARHPKTTSERGGARR